jgi:hypothetical protein
MPADTNTGEIKIVQTKINTKLLQDIIADPNYIDFTYKSAFNRLLCIERYNWSIVKDDLITCFKAIGVLYVAAAFIHATPQQMENLCTITSTITSIYTFYRLYTDDKLHLPKNLSSEKQHFLEEKQGLDKPF